MALYQTGFKRLDTVCAQVLLTQDDFLDPLRRRNLRTALEKLLKMGVIPIINENDTVATLELERIKVFGDNDKLSALVAAGLSADLLLILSDVDGLHEANPRHAPGAPLLREVSAITPELLALAQGGSTRGRGGMATKLEAAGLGMAAGVTVVIANGERVGVINAALVLLLLALPGAAAARDQVAERQPRQRADVRVTQQALDAAALALVGGAAAGHGLAEVRVLARDLQPHEARAGAVAAGIAVVRG